MKKRKRLHFDELLTQFLQKGESVLLHYYYHPEVVDPPKKPERPGVREWLIQRFSEVAPPGMEKTVQALKKKKEVTNPFALCLSGDTPIPCLDGITRTVKEMAESQETYWVYGFDLKQFLVVPAAARARNTGPRQLVEIELDNGELLKCSPEHRWLLRDGTFVEAKNLQIGASLVPFRRCYEKIGHEKVYQPGLGWYAPTHWSVMRCISPGAASGGYEIHHKNSNPRDNRPENLEWLTKYEHCLRHPERMRAMQIAERSEEGKIRHRESSRSVMQKNWSNPEFREKVTARNRQNAKVAGQMGGEVNRKVTKDVEDKILHLYVECGLTIKAIASHLGLCNATIRRFLVSCGMERGKMRGAGAVNTNHSVVRVTLTDKLEEMYDVAVDDAHIFAVGQGVFSHNSWWLKKHRKSLKTEATNLKLRDEKFRKLFQALRNLHKKKQAKR